MAITRPILCRLAAPAPLALHIGQSYPNPFTSGDGSVSIPYTLSSSAHITVKIHNSAGKEVATLADGGFSPGSYTAVWDPSDALSGVYFCTLSSATQKAVARVVVLR